MNRYKVTIEQPSITLTLTKGRFKEFKKDEIVDENGYTNRFPKIFKKIGVVKGYDQFLATPTFVPDEEKKSKPTKKGKKVKDVVGVKKIFDDISIKEELDTQKAKKDKELEDLEDSEDLVPVFLTEE